MVLETLMSAVANALSILPRRGATKRAIIAELDATEPFIGDTNTPTPNAATDVPAPVQRNIRSIDENSVSATLSRCNKMPINTYRGRACSKSCSSSPKIRPLIAPSTWTSIRPTSQPPTANRLAVPMSKAQTGRPVVKISIANTTSIHMPAVGNASIMTVQYPVAAAGWQKPFPLPQRVPTAPAKPGPRAK